MKKKKKKNTSQAKQFDTIDKRSNVKNKTLKNNLEQFGRAKHNAFFQS